MRRHHDETVMIALELTYPWSSEEIDVGRRLEQINFLDPCVASNVVRLFTGMGWNVVTYHSSMNGWLFKPGRRSSFVFLRRLCESIVRDELLPEKCRWETCIRYPDRRICLVYEEKDEHQST